MGAVGWLAGADRFRPLLTKLESPELPGSCVGAAAGAARKRGPAYAGGFWGCSAGCDDGTGMAGTAGAIVCGSGRGNGMARGNSACVLLGGAHRGIGGGVGMACGRVSVSDPVGGAVRPRGKAASAPPGVLVKGASGAVAAGRTNDPRSLNVRIVSDEGCLTLLNEFEDSVGTARRRVSDSGAAPTESAGMLRRGAGGPAAPRAGDAGKDRRGVSRL